MPIISDGQIARAALSAGWQGNDAVTAVAVALAESSGRSDARNSIGASGLWQVLESAHPEFHQQWKDGTWKDPTVNAKMGYSVYKAAGNSFRPWVQYTTGTYRMFVNRAKAAVGNPAADTGGADVSSSLKDSAGGSGFGIADAVKFLTDSHNWLRVGEFVLGLVLVLLGLARISGIEQKAVSVAKTYASVVPLGTL